MSMGVAVAVGASGCRSVVIVRVMQRRRAGMRGPGTARALEAAVREVAMTTLEITGKECIFNSDQFSSGVLEEGNILNMQGLSRLKTMFTRLFFCEDQLFLIITNLNLVSVI